MKKMVLALIAFTLMACGQKDQNTSGQQPIPGTVTPVNTSFNTLNSSTGTCISRTVDGFINVSKGVVEIAGRSYRVSNVQPIIYAIDVARSQNINPTQSPEGQKYTASITAQAVPTQAVGYGTPTNLQGICDSDILNVTQAVIRR